MSKFGKKMAAKVAPFAHLLGIRAAAETEQTEDDKKEEAKRAEWAEKAEDDPERKQKEGESDDDYAQRMEEMDDAEDDPDGDKDSDKDAKGAKGAKGKKAEDPSEGLEDESDDAKAIRQSERVRCARIIDHGIKNGCVNQAGIFAFDTSMSADQAIASLNAATLDAVGRRPGLGQRMAGEPAPRAGMDIPAGGDGGDPQAQASALARQVIAAAAKARGEKV